ncbi:MAG TPA: S4 domain-containing protein, partial [Dehalococcoidales bacterium]|nr:S4 domain-containing protein [Dehalococcoidales bacterium]
MKQISHSYQFTVETSGNRLDKFVSEHCAELSRSQAQKLIDDGFVVVNGLMEKASHKTEIGEKIEVTIPPPSIVGLLPEAIPVK